MMRSSLIVYVSLIFGITAKPYKPWNKIPDVSVKDTVMSMDNQGKVSWRVEVEPPEGRADTPYNIDPNMKIWKSMTGADKDELYHQSVEDLLKVQVQNLDSLPAANVQTEPLNENVKSYREPEEDRDRIDHPVFINIPPEIPEQAGDKVYHKVSDELATLMAGTGQRVAHSKPETDRDDLYHRVNQFYLQPAPPVQMKQLRSELRLHLEPEDDMDALYHKDVPQLIPQQDDIKAVAPVYLPSQQKHTEPEEDRDGLYHQ